MRQVKICGLKRPKDIAIVNRLKPDYCGFVINFPKSHRSLKPAQVQILASGLDKSIKAVGIFVNQPTELVAGLLDKESISIAQLHGDEDNAYITELKKLTDKPIWQAIQVKCEEDLAKAEASAADFILLDAGQGSGERFDWSLLSRLKRPFGLAGGLKPDNLGEALKTEAILFDVSGGVETDKKKDEKKIELFINTIREAE